MIAWLCKPTRQIKSANINISCLQAWPVWFRHATTILWRLVHCSSGIHRGHVLGRFNTAPHRFKLANRPHWTRNSYRLLPSCHSSNFPRICGLVPPILRIPRWRCCENLLRRRIRRHIWWPLFHASYFDETSLNNESHPRKLPCLGLLTYLAATSLYIFDADFLLSRCLHHAARCHAIFPRSNLHQLIQVGLVLLWHSQRSLPHKESLRYRRWWLRAALRWSHLQKCPPDAQWGGSCPHVGNSSTS